MNSLKIFGVVAMRIADHHADHMGPGLKAFDELNERSRRWRGESFVEFCSGDAVPADVALMLRSGDCQLDESLLRVALALSAETVATLLTRVGDELLSAGHSNPISDAQFARRAAEYSEQAERDRRELSNNGLRIQIQKRLARGLPVAILALEQCPDLLAFAAQHNLVMSST